MRPTYTLTYFDARGRAEPIRLLLSYAGVPFEDRGFTGETWPKEKADAPLGQVPYLVERRGSEAFAIPQTMAIVRHLSRELGLDGKDERERLAADVAAETAVDLRAAAAALRFSPAWADEGAKAKFAAETAPLHLARLDKLLGDRAWFASDVPTYADICVFDTVDSLVTHWPTILAQWARLAAFHGRVRTLPQLSQYLGSRRPA